MLFLRLLRHPRLQRLLTIDPSLRDWNARHKPQGHQRLCYADDPADLQGIGGRTQARTRYGLRPQGPVVLLFGSIDMRKGVAALLALYAALNAVIRLPWFELREVVVSEIERAVPLLVAGGARS